MHHFILSLLFLASLLVAPRPANAAAKANVILIMADDLGSETIGANGGTSYKTPVLDKLAATGVRFEHCYAQPLCTPTRIQLMTGQYNVRNYTDFGVMDPALKTFGNFFKNAGYATCIAGKWQLGRDPELPQKFGFDEACLWQHLRRPERYKNPGLEINGKEVDYTNGEYGPDIVNAYALDFIKRKKDGPFFLYYPMMLTHSPYDPTPDSPDYAGEAKAKRERKADRDGSDPHFADMVAYMDKLIGKLVARLDELGLRDDTLILFTGDNGTGAGTRSMMGDKLVIGGKGKTTRAGMHVPLIASWPGRIASGKVCADLVDSSDFLPTICEAAGRSVPSELKLDGRSFLPQLRGEKGNPRQWYYCWYAPRRQMVGEFAANHRYKLYRNGNFHDLAQDLEETKPLKVSALEGEAAAAAKLLQSALDQYKDARPANLETPGERTGKKCCKKLVEIHPSPQRTTSGIGISHSFQS
ncbi:MAG: sulfatase-like hydrolase/transferase [Verrucomicrobiota bacterium]|nr:sulfatase-like hydrolase/transferase [Verrucomicrobiota bacterium]